MGPHDNQGVTAWDDSAGPSRKRIVWRAYRVEQGTKMWVMSGHSRLEGREYHQFPVLKVKIMKKWSNRWQVLLTFSHSETDQSVLPFTRRQLRRGSLPSFPFLGGRGRGTSTSEPEGGESAWCSDVQAACGTSPWDFPKDHKMLSRCCYCGSQLKNWISSLHEMG